MDGITIEKSDVKEGSEATITLTLKIAGEEKTTVYASTRAVFN